MKKLLYTILFTTFALVSCNKGYRAPIAPEKILQDYVVGYWTIDGQHPEAFHVEENQFFHGKLEAGKESHSFTPDSPTFHVQDNDGEKITYEMEDFDYHCIIYVSMGEKGKLKVRQDIQSAGKIHDYVCSRVSGKVFINSPGGFNPHPGF